jgi:hypothetical protein
MALEKQKAVEGIDEAAIELGRLNKTHEGKVIE